MIKCNSCDFFVSDSLKYSLINNVCPACGAALYKDSEMREISRINVSIKNEAFAQSFDDVIINDISLFIFANYVNIDEPVGDIAQGTSSDSEGEVLASGEMDESSPEEIRNAVREEVLKSGSFDRSEDDDGDEEYKVARLKRLAKSGASGVKNVAVRRVE